MDVNMMEIKKQILESKIDNVIVYQSGCQLTLVGSINLTEGEQLITITNLPENLDKESVRVKGIGNGKIINIIVEFNSRREYKKEEHKKLQEEREKLEKTIKKSEKELFRVNEQITKFKSTEDIFYDGWAKAFAFGETSLNNFVEFDEKINETIKTQANLADSLEERIKTLKKELRVILNKMSNLGPIEEVHNFYEVVLNLQVLKEGVFNIEIRYTLKNCWWQPFYDVELSEENIAKFTMMANVHNRTGLDWDDVELEISTASLKPIALIRPNPMILQEYIPYIAPKGKFEGKKRAKKDMKEKEVELEDLMMDEGECEEDYDMPCEEPEPEPEIEASYAEVSDSIGVQSFKIPDRLDIPSDKNPHPVNLTVLKLETEKKYYWSSAAPENVIIIDTLVNKDLLLLPGNVKIYFMEEFLGETSIDLIAPKEKFKLGTRVTYDLKIDKKLIDRSKAKKAIKGKLKNNYEYKIVIKNLNDVTDELTVLDRIPHSNSESIKVVVEGMIPEPNKKQLGVLKWKMNLKGVKEKVIKYKYFVEYKKGINITPSLP